MKFNETWNLLVWVELLSKPLFPPTFFHSRVPTARRCDLWARSARIRETSLPYTRLPALEVSTTFSSWLYLELINTLSHTELKLPSLLIIDHIDQLVSLILVAPRQFFSDTWDIQIYSQEWICDEYRGIHLSKNLTLSN